MEFKGIHPVWWGVGLISSRNTRDGETESVTIINPTTFYTNKDKEMIGGNILSFSASDNVVTFYVKEKQSMSTCHVKASMNQHVQKLIDIGSSIWWDSQTVYMTIEGVPDCKFNKVGFSY